MVHYSASDNLQRDISEFAHAHRQRDWLCRHQVTADPESILARLLAMFEQRFGSVPTPEPTPLITNLDADQLEELAASTIGHYDDSADSFLRGTWDHDVSQNTATLLKYLPGPAPQRILDVGCGPGRDLLFFASEGHTPVGLDGSLEFVHMAKQRSGCQVLHQNMLEFDLPSQHFHGVFANASLFHVPSQELGRVLGELWQTLVPGGVLFCSNPRGPNQEGFHDRRYGSYLDLAAWRAFLRAARFHELEHYYRPTGVARHKQPWLASAWRKLDCVDCGTD